MLRPDQLELLENTPPHWRFALTGGGDDVKRCFEEGWNEPGKGHTLQDIRDLNDNPPPKSRWRAQKMIGIGVITGEESNGLLVIDFDGFGSEAVRAFRRHFRHYPSQLPKTLVNISGKKGRAKVYFQVPPHWWPQLKDKSASWRNAQDATVLEAIWQNGTGRGRHAVIAGDHPHSSHQLPLFYRWVNGASPVDVPLAMAPEWLLLGVLAQMQSTESVGLTHHEKLRRGEDDATPWERLSCYERRELVELALTSCPNREGRSSGTYEKVRRILCGIMHEFGLEHGIELVTSSEWDKRNTWDAGNNTEQTMRSLAKSRVSDEQQARIATIFYFARQNGWEPPSWAIPPVEMKLQVETFRKFIAQMNKSQGDNMAMATYYGRARREFGIEKDTMRRLALQEYLGAAERSTPKSLEQVTTQAHAGNMDGDVLDGFLGRRVHVLVGASHSGKTTLACFLANRVVHGLPVDVDGLRHSAERKGKVLIFTSDCSDLDLMRDLALEGITSENANDRVRICSGTTFDDMLRICQLLAEFEPDLVIYDCLSSMAAMDVKVGDPSYADPIRLLVRHNGLAWPKCAHLILHHTSRDEPTRYSGTEQIKAAAEEMLVYYPPELLKWKKGTPRPPIGPTRHLVVEKSRSGYSGRTISITRNPYQGHWQLTLPTLEGTSPIQTMIEKFRKVSDDDWRIASEWNALLELGYNSRSLRRYLDQLVGTTLEVSKQKSRVTGRMDTHYRPRELMRDAARQMVSSRGDGVNQI